MYSGYVVCSSLKTSNERVAESCKQLVCTGKMGMRCFVLPKDKSDHLAALRFPCFILPTQLRRQAWLATSPYRPLLSVSATSQQQSSDLINRLGILYTIGYTQARLSSARDVFDLVLWK